jgi:hypothetical protein
VKKGLLVGAYLWCALALAAPPAKPNQIARAVIGAEYVSAPNRPNAPGCTHRGGSVISAQDVPTDFSYQLMSCGSQWVLALEQLVGRVDNKWPRLRILDATALPSFKSNATESQLHVRQIVNSGDCTLDGRRDRTMLVLVRWGKGDRITSRNGVITAWGFDLEAGKIILLDTSRIECEKPTPP